MKRKFKVAAVVTGLLILGAVIYISNSSSKAIDPSRDFSKVSLPKTSSHCDCAIGMQPPAAAHANTTGSATSDVLSASTGQTQAVQSAVVPTITPAPQSQTPVQVQVSEKKPDQTPVNKKNPPQPKIDILQPVTQLLNLHL